MDAEELAAKIKSIDPEALRHDGTIDVHRLGARFGRQPLAARWWRRWWSMWGLLAVLLTALALIIWEACPT